MKHRLKMLLVFFSILVIICLVTFSFNPTSSRYLKTLKDEIYATYTSLYFDTTGEGKSVSLEDNIGYIGFELMNYIDEDVTKRDIEYTIKSTTEFYDATATKIDSLDGVQDLYVLDLWGQPKKIGNDTSKYNVDVVSNDGEVTADDSYLFSYEKLGNSAVGKTHKVIVKIERKTKLNEGKIDELTLSDINGVEKISIIVTLTKPYKEVFIINVNVSNKLISFSNVKEKMFDIETESVYIQSANIYSHYADGNERKSADELYTYTAHAIKLTLTWNNLIINKKVLDQNHIPYGNDFSDIDITKPYIESLINNNLSGEMVIYVPQGSDFNLNYIIPYDVTNYNLDVKIEINVVKDDINSYELYTEDNFQGYIFNLEGKYSLISK